MSLKDEIRDYLDPENFVSPDFRPKTRDTSGNLLLYTSIYYILLVMLGLARDEDFKVYYCLFRSCQKIDADRVTLLKGLFNRSPRKTDQNGPDDYIGIATSAAFMAATFGREILDYGRLNDFNYNNEKPEERNWSSWFGRMPQVVAHFYFASGKNPSLWRKIWWFFSVITVRGSSSNWILSWLLVITAKEKSSICELGAEIWKWRLKNSKTYEKRVFRALGEFACHY